MSDKIDQAQVPNAEIGAVPSDESFEPKVVNEFETAPRGEPRIPGISLESVDNRLNECADFFSKHCDEADYRNLDWYLQRSQLHFAAGDDVFEVIDDMFLAARCLHDRSAMHLDLKPPEMFITRRIMPVEVGIISGMPMLTLEFSAMYGLPLMMVLGKTAPENIMEEANLLTSFFRREFCADFYELAGLCAVIYAGVIAAIGRGYDDEATIALSTYGKARDSLRGAPPQSILPKIRRYDVLNTALACLCNGNFELIGGLLAQVAEWFAEENAKKAGDAYLNPTQYPVPKYYDTSILTILALAALRGKVIELPETGAIAQYRCFIKGLTEMPERRIEVPGLDEEAREILQKAGVDPDQLNENGLIDDSFHTAKEESEDRARRLFEEKQRQAQQAVREKLAREALTPENNVEDSHLYVEPRKVEHDELKMTDDSVESSARFFDMAEQADPDDEARRANAESDHQPDTSREARDFSNFFDASDDRPQIEQDEIHLDASAQEEKPGKDFSNFFSQNDEEDQSNRDFVEKEMAPVEQHESAGRDFGSFFDNISENDIPKFDDGTADADAEEEQPKARSFSEDFFNSETKSSYDLKMTLDDEEEEKPAPKPNKPAEKVRSLLEQAREERRRSSVEEEFGEVETRDFSRIFDEDAPTNYGLRMTLDDEDERGAAAEKPAAPKPRVEDKYARIAREEREAQIRELEEEQNRRREAAFVGQHLALSEDDEPDLARLDAHPAEALRGLETKTVSINDARSEQIRELEELQAQKMAEEKLRREQNALRLELDDDDEPAPLPESHADRVARLIAERQQAAREQALKEREEALRELEELKQQDHRPKVEHLKLTLDEPTDPDEVTEKVAPDDLVIKGFSYTELDMIHSNTAQREELEEDFDMHAAIAQKNFEEAQQKADEAKQADSEAQKTAERHDDIDDLIDFSKL